MKYRKLRATLALLLVLSVFVSFCSLTAFAAGPGSLIDNLTGTWRDSMNEIRAIIIFKESFDPRGGTMPDGSTEAFVVEMPMGIPFRLPAAPEKEGDTFLGWEAVGALVICLVHGVGCRWLWQLRHIAFARSRSPSRAWIVSRRRRSSSPTSPSGPSAPA